MSCFKRALRESRKTDMLRKIYGVKHDTPFTWTQIRAALPNENLPRTPPPSLIAEGMIIIESKQDPDRKVWKISKDYIGWLRETETGIPA